MCICSFIYLSIDAIVVIEANKKCKNHRKAHEVII